MQFRKVTIERGNTGPVLKIDFSASMDVDQCAQIVKTIMSLPVWTKAGCGTASAALRSPSTSIRTSTAPVPPKKRSGRCDEPADLPAHTGD